MTPRVLRQLARACVAAAWAVLVASAGVAQAACPPHCVTAGSVVNAAGVPDGLAAAAARLQFKGPGLAPGSQAAVQALAAEIRRLPAGASVSLHLRTDAGLAGNAASQQASSRQRALQQALQAAGVKPGQVRLEAGS